MGLTGRNQILSYLTVCTIICLHTSRSYGELESGFKIFRDEQDIFTNLEIKSDEDKGSNISSPCKKYHAECTNEGTNCTYCRCQRGFNTFMISKHDKSKGSCTRDEYIDPDSVPAEATWLKNKMSGKCLKVEGDSNSCIFGANCSTSTAPDMLWIRTGEDYNQFMSISTLKCMRLSGRKNGSCAAARECINGQANWQKARCMYNSTESGLKFKWRIKKTANGNITVDRFLNMQSDNLNAIASTEGNQLWDSKQTKQFCETKMEYKGCYRFSDGSFVKYLDFSETHAKLNISAPIFQRGGKQISSCTVGGKYNFTEDGQTWLSSSSNSSSFSITGLTRNVQIMAINMAVLRPWNGSLLKFDVSCADRNKKENHCVVIKLKTLSSYDQNERKSSTEPAQSLTSTTPTTAESTRMQNDRKLSTESVQSLTSTTPTTAESTQDILSAKKSQSGGANSIVVGVTVTLLLVALILALGFFVGYRRRKRAESQLAKKNGENC